MFLQYLVLVLSFADFTDQAYVPPRLELKRLSTEPIISSWNNGSEFLYNYNSAFMPTVGDPNAVALLVRVQNLRPDAKSIYDVGPSLIALSRSVDGSLLNYTRITKDAILIDLSQEYQSIGVEDPRLVLVGNTYYV